MKKDYVVIYEYKAFALLGEENVEQGYPPRGSVNIPCYCIGGKFYLPRNPAKLIIPENLYLNLPENISQIINGLIEKEKIIKPESGTIPFCYITQGDYLIMNNLCPISLTVISQLNLLRKKLSDDEWNTLPDRLICKSPGVPLPVINGKSMMFEDCGGHG